MSDTAPQFFAGTLAVGADPDWERVARTLDLVRASGVRIVTAPAVTLKDGKTELPFFTKSGGILQMLDGGSADPRRTIEAVSPYAVGAYAKLDPRNASTRILSALVKLESDNSADAPTRASDLKPLRAPTRTADDAFEGLVGLDRQRQILRKVGTLVSKHGRGVVECLHMVFAGPPGTGKSELARRLLSYYDATGVTSGDGIFVEVSAGDLVARYVGHTPGRTRAVVERALGGMLFIDEAYGLVSAGSFGQQAIDTLVELLENERGRLVCVIAGYPDKLEELFRCNSGLRDRFGFRVEFQDYTTPELEAIFGTFARKRGFTLEPGASAELHRCIDGLRGKRGFSNARTVRRLFERSIMETAMRSDGTSISAADLAAAFAEPDLGGDKRGGTVGFAR